MWYYCLDPSRFSWRNSPTDVDAQGGNEVVENRKVTFPSISERNWWNIRKRFAQTLPAVVSPTYVSSVLQNMTLESARANVINPLRLVGLIDDERKPTELARRWRDDAQYAAVCETIRDTVYPQELRDAFPEPLEDINGVRSWFANHTGLGADAARKMSQFYTLLWIADPTQQNASATTTKVTRDTSMSAQDNSSKNRPSKNVPQQRSQAARNRNKDSDGQSGSPRPNGPSIHLNIQIHISPDMTPSQIDQVFASMAKHLGTGRQESDE